MCWCTPSIRTPWCGKPGCVKPGALAASPNQQPALGARLFREWCIATFGPVPAWEGEQGITLDDIYRKAVEFSTHTPIETHKPHVGDMKCDGSFCSKPSGMKVQFIGEEQEPPL